MNKKSLVLGGTTLVGLIIGIVTRHYALWTITGLAVGYIVTFWWPWALELLRNRKQR
ncbi:hypothetical protein [Schleiferilactobacillus perolens]|uniref:hypothetical protein n=1 Tax=Schleiferilactobacillus perolens TaxID=100468 RepID=UPI002353FF2E|nr:hypothetical protein [Schleiferilactobacillus perolens]MCI1892331.1 hypothetical protein [Schleiferilactobacillus harbinensis]MCI1913744.1 hypothetical protein [Schleiferilactobacillus harbinensis]MCI2171565.1 hypothetical protein [Schleiferilactobacillus perolens]